MLYNCIKSINQAGHPISKTTFVNLHSELKALDLPPFEGNNNGRIMKTHKNLFQMKIVYFFVSTFWRG